MQLLVCLRTWPGIFATYAVAGMLKGMGVDHTPSTAAGMLTDDGWACRGDASPADGQPGSSFTRANRRSPQAEASATAAMGWYLPFMGGRTHRWGCIRIRSRASPSVRPLPRLVTWPDFSAAEWIGFPHCVWWGRRAFESEGQPRTDGLLRVSRRSAQRLMDG